MTASGEKARGKMKKKKKNHRRGGKKNKSITASGENHCTKRELFLKKTDGKVPGGGQGFVTVMLLWGLTGHGENTSTARYDVIGVWGETRLSPGPFWASDRVLGRVEGRHVWLE